LEVSGRVNLEAATELARAGAEFLSIGALTHSAPVWDVGLDEA
jgi:nicotinate-nucleotide pyrophosphorylase (carboxylating)